MAKKKREPARPARLLAGLADAHTHLYSLTAKGGGTTTEIVDRAAAAGVQRIVTVGDDLAESRAALAAAHEDPRVWAAVAVHPVRAEELDAAARAELAELASNPRCVAVGETGLDYYWTQHEPDTTASPQIQEEALRWHIDLAVETGKALMIHNRDADADLLRILADSPSPRHVILHCFSSPLDVARTALERGYVLSFAGNVTFKRNAELREAARLAPAGQLLIETDAPYMTPEPYRGQRNEPAYIGHTALCVAESRGLAVDELLEEVNATFSAVYGVR